MMIRDKVQFATMLAAARGTGKRMSPDQYRAALAVLEWTQGQAAEYFGHRLRQVTRYLAGEQPVPYVIGWTLEYLVANGEK